MGRPPWATSEQTAFLESYLPSMDEEKENHGLAAFYARVTDDFILRWKSPTIPIPKDRQDGVTPEAYANERRGRVSLSLHFPSLH